jgi:ABC-type Na+ transport system ATPase subunit NatA
MIDDGGKLASIRGYFPPLNLLLSFASLGRMLNGFSLIDMWHDDLMRLLMKPALVNLPLFAGLLLVVEWPRIVIPGLLAKSKFSEHAPFFVTIQGRQAITDEARAAGSEAIEGNAGQFVIGVREVSRLFFDEKERPIAAVNNVSMGIRPGSLFGFLRANGAGKSTLLKLITGEIAVSDGQIDRLDLGEHRDKPVNQLSGGTARKLAIALAMLSPAAIVLLDEPASSLDAIVRHRVHDPNYFRGQKTFMLCTHRLGEAEALCDTISIMLKAQSTSWELRNICQAVSERNGESMWC